MAAPGSGRNRAGIPSDQRPRVGVVAAGFGQTALPDQRLGPPFQSAKLVLVQDTAE